MSAAVLSANAVYLLLAFLPPIAWLLFYLREDQHPEPKLLLILTFMGGILAAILALFIECVWIFTMSGSCKNGINSNLNPWILFSGIALIEEYVKYIPVKYLVIARCKKHQKCDLDEPVDAMVYMMTSAMGFAALENTLFIFPLFQQEFLAGLVVAVNRFLGANFLHVLASGIVGFFLARSWFYPKRRHFLTLGILLASLLHTGFNYLILIRDTLPQGIFYIILLLATMAVMVFIEFERLKQKPQI